VKQPSLVWIYPGRLDQDLDASTWLTTTAELRSMGWQVTLIAAGPSGNKMIGGIEVTCVPMTNIYFFRQIIFHVGIYWLLLARHLDPTVVMFSQMSALWMLPLRLLRFFKRQKRPLLALDFRTVHMDDPGKQKFKDWLRGLFQDLVGKYAGYWVDGYLAITDRMADYLRLDRQRLWGVWPSGVDLDLFKPTQTSHVWPGDGTPVRLIYVGVLHYERNLMNLCQAVEQANAEGMDFEFWLVGNGTERPALEEFASKTNGRIRVFAPIPHDQVPGMLAQAHIGALPFHDELKFQVSSFIKLFEYIGSGLPLLATRINCLTDVVGDDDYAFWAKNADVSGLLDALRLAWQRRAELGKMSSLSAASAPNWTWRASAVKLKNALETGMEKNPE
jgi:glycosyltransferase involved in cell wall biosynthesis